MTALDNQFTTLWHEILQQIRQKINEPSYNTWFTGAELVAQKDNHWVILISSDIARNMISHNYYDVLAETIRDVYGQDVNMTFAIDGENIESLLAADETVDHDAPRHQHLQNERLIQEFRLNPNYTFDNFVIGKGNQYAHAASLAVAETMANSLTNQKIYNPLFIHGSSGLGKTHLMQAIAHHILVHQPDAKTKYVSSETFTNELIDSIMTSKTQQFRERYRNVDILLIDDIQFVSSKEGTQEEFFHTFNELYQANKQIIIASDRPPKEIPMLEERLRNRFEWGIITDIQQPDLETRIAILRKKAKMDDKIVPNDVMIYMAEHIQSNIRELEGALLNLTAFAALSNQPITLDMAKDFLSSYIRVDENKVITVENIQKKVCETYGIRIEDIKGKRRQRNYVVPRQVAMYLCREMTDLSLPKIGEHFGGRDHTTVMHAINKIEESVQKDPVLKGSINGIRKDLTGA